MANPTKNFGMLPYKDDGGGCFPVETLDKTTGAANYRGEPLSLVAAGTYTAATADTPIDAVCAVSASATDTTIQAWITTPTQRWLINSNASVALADKGGAFDIVVASSPDTTIGITDVSLNISTIDTTGQLILMDKHPNDAWEEDDVRCVVAVYEGKWGGSGAAAAVVT